MLQYIKCFGKSVNFLSADCNIDPAASDETFIVLYLSTRLYTTFKGFPAMVIYRTTLVNVKSDIGGPKLTEEEKFFITQTCKVIQNMQVTLVVRSNILKKCGRCFVKNKNHWVIFHPTVKFYNEIKKILYWSPFRSCNNYCSYKGTSKKIKIAIMWYFG
jgi:hypothetical protein